MNVRSGWVFAVSNNAVDAVKLFRNDPALFRAGPNGIAAHGLINAGFSRHLGAGVGVFDRCSVPWTPDYDEVLLYWMGC